MHALKDNATQQFELAANIFPFDRFIVTAPAFSYVIAGRYDQDTMEQFKRAFKYDPYAMDLRKIVFKRGLRK